MHMVESGNADNKSELLQKLRSTKGNIKTYRKDLEKKIADWKDEYLKRKEKRQNDNRHEKLYANAEDLMIDEDPIKEKNDLTSKPKTKLHDYIERNGEILSIGIGFITLTTSLIILGMKMSKNN